MDTIYLSKLKKKAREEKAIVVFEDEASFRQSPTLYCTWAPRNSQSKIPTQGQRNTQKIFGAISLYDLKFAYRHQKEYFNAETYITFLEETLLPEYYRRNHRIFLIHDNATYHKKPEVYEWFRKNRRKIETFLLPSYSPEFNAVERLWHYTRMKATHNRYYEKPNELCQALFDTFSIIQESPTEVEGLIRPFF